jgi:Na+/H+ antiporter
LPLSAHDELQLLGLLIAVAALLVLAPTLRVPYPILLVLGGLGLSFVPGLPDFELPPELVLVGVLPPLLYSSAFFTSLRDLRTYMRPIGLLSIGLVIATTLGVAAVAHAVVSGLSWAAAFTLGAIVSPTDPLAATPILRRLGVPRRIVAVVEGESLVNDGTGLVLYRVAIAAAVSGSFSLSHAAFRLVVNVVVGVAVGLAVGYLVRRVRRVMDNPPSEITIALLTGYFAYLPAEALGVSAVLAAVTAGVYMGWHTPELTTAETRLQGDAFWRILVFLLNSLLFVLIGLQLPHVVEGLAPSTASLVGDAAAVCAAVVVIRILWVFPLTYLPRFLSRRLRERDPYPPWQYPALAAWVGMRGSVSLAAALALPLETDAGAAFPGRDLIIFLTFTVILGTLVVQGLTLPLLVRVLRLEDDGKDAKEEAKARIRAAEAALARLEQLVDEGGVREDTAERVRGAYNFRRNRFTARFDAADDGAIEERSLAFQRLRRELLAAEQQAILALRREGVINDDVMHRVQRDLDLEESRLDI